MHDKIVLYCDLDIIGWFQLPIEHMILFHAHKGCFQICFGIAVPVFPHDLKTIFIAHQTRSAFFQLFIEFLDLRFVLSFSLNKLDSFSLRNPY